MHPSTRFTRDSQPTRIARVFSRVLVLLFLSLPTVSSCTCDEVKGMCTDDGCYQAAGGADCNDGSKPSDMCTDCSACSDTGASCPSQTITCAQAESSGIGIETPCGSTDVYDGPQLQEPIVLESSEGILEATLSVEQYKYDNGVYNFNTRAFCYEGACTVPGPTFKIRPGDTLKITLVNGLQPNIDDETSEMNTLRHPNTTNIHTHGLHVDPSTDNIFVTVESGESHTYEYYIPSDHMPGNHWYHSHVHGASTLHVLGGMVGALLVEFSDSETPPVTYSAMEAHTLVLSHHPLCSCNPTSDPFRIIDYEEIRTKICDQMPLDANVYSSPEISDAYDTNGQYQPYLNMQPGEWHRFDVVNAVADVFLELEIRDAVNAGSTACEMKLLSIDGVFLLEGPRDISYFSLVIAGRASIAVMCSTVGTYYFQSYPQQRACDYESGFAQNLLTLKVDGSTVSMDAPAWGSSAISRPYYLQDLRSITANYTWQVGVEQTGVSEASPAAAWLGVGTDCELKCDGRDSGSTYCEDSPNTYGECRYEAFAGEHGSYRHSAPLCSYEDLYIQGRGATPHPMHIHVNHFQTISQPDNADKGYGEVGDFRDTIPAFSGTTVVRYALDTYGGAIVVHCHFLYHEDLGMMDRFWAGPEVEACKASGGGDTGESFSYCDTYVPSPDAFSSSYTTVQEVCQSATSTSQPTTGPTPAASTPSSPTVTPTSPRLRLGPRFLPPPRQLPLPLTLRTQLGPRFHSSPSTTSTPTSVSHFASYNCITDAC
ncbi:hypothetical protein CYMTET_56307 [Cymbomonas tetramitiformis]|uniref:Multicopper oxidase n=1 Tax=Cymbomonas tetramitiformis TaxID=36881 RepID=A0AAE0ELY8_9CHLO|nr:hypothetical protein CYMTET_56307 [Cymbomonas tetramitiformis]